MTNRRRDVTITSLGRRECRVLVGGRCVSVDRVQLLQKMKNTTCSIRSSPAIRPMRPQTWTWVGSIHGLDWVGLGWVENFPVLVGWVGLGLFTHMVFFL